MPVETVETYTFTPGKRSMFSPVHKKTKQIKSPKRQPRRMRSHQRRFAKR